MQLDPLVLTAILWVGLCLAAWKTPAGIPALWELRSSRSSRWPVGVQEENDERPWYQRRGTPEWRSLVAVPAFMGTGRYGPRVPRVAYVPPDEPQNRYTRSEEMIDELVDLTDAGRHAPAWAAESRPPTLEKVRGSRRHHR